MSMRNSTQVTFKPQIDFSTVSPSTFESSADSTSDALIMTHNSFNSVYFYQRSTALPSVSAFFCPFRSFQFFLVKSYDLGSHQTAEREEKGELLQENNPQHKAELTLDYPGVDYVLITVFYSSSYPSFSTSFIFLSSHHSGFCSLHAGGLLSFHLSCLSPNLYPLLLHWCFLFYFLPPYALSTLCF